MVPSGDDGILSATTECWGSPTGHKEVIKTAREVASIEVEKAIYAATRVREVVVVGCRRALSGRSQARRPEPGETIDPGGLIAAAEARLDGFKVPKAVLSLGQLTKTYTGRFQEGTCALRTLEVLTRRVTACRSSPPT